MPDDVASSFMQDILANPDDDGPRLIYADWLDDQDQHARAELIRVECAMARLSPLDPERKQRGQRAGALRKECWRTLLCERPAGIDLLRPTTYRGFWAGICCTMSAYERLAPRTFRLCPIERADLYNITPAMLHKLVRSKYLARLRWLKLRPFGTWDAEAARTLASCRYLGSLRELEIMGGNVMGDEGARALAESPHLGTLQSLHLMDTTMTPAGVALLEARFGAAVRVYRIGFRRVTADPPGPER
jgi:uncharacterized protein (TIGR02996 family)